MSTQPQHKLRDFVLDREDLIRQASVAIDRVVARQEGGYGFAVRAAYRMARGLAPNMIHQLVDELLEDFLDALTPFYHEAVERDVRVDHHIQSQKTRVAEALLAVTDGRNVKRAGPLKKGYESLRPKALARLADATPELGALVHDNIPAELRPGERVSTGASGALQASA